VENFSREMMKLELGSENIDYISQLGNESVEQPIIMRFTTFLIKLQSFFKK
jgi:hypothetical protein